MTVKQLINELLDMPMEAEVEACVYDEHLHLYTYYKARHALRYEDKVIGIISENMVQEVKNAR